MEWVSLVDRGWVFVKNLNQWTAINILAYKMVLLCLFSQNRTLFLEFTESGAIKNIQWAAVLWAKNTANGDREWPDRSTWQDGDRNQK